MSRNWKRCTVSSFAIAAIILCLSCSTSFAEDRVVILAPAAADVVERLGAGELVVGVTDSVEEFPAARRLGIHLRPSVELIASLRPTLIISASRFDPDLAERLGADHVLYEPKSLAAIVVAVRDLGIRLGRQASGEALARELQAVLDGLIVPDHRPTVFYEITASPLTMAGSATVIGDLLERAGMRNLHGPDRAVVSTEYLLAHQPDMYLYQIGPMNKGPEPPTDRPGWGGFDACVWKVDEFAFARPNTRLFETVRQLNAVLNSENLCEGGAIFYPEDIQ